MNETPPEFMGAEGHSKGEDKFNFRMIVLEALRRIGTLSAKEMRGGYHDLIYHPGPNNVLVHEKKYVPDARMEYANSVLYLGDILLPHYDGEMRKAEELCDTHIKKLIQNTTLDKDQSSDQKYYLTRDLFRALCKFLKRIDYLQTGAREE